MSFWTELADNMTHGLNGAKSYTEIGKGLYDSNASRALSGMQDAVNVALDITTKGKNPLGMDKARRDFETAWNRVQTELNPNSDKYKHGKVSDDAYFELISSAVAFLSYGSYFIGDKRTAGALAGIAAVTGIVASLIDDDLTVIDDMLINLIATAEDLLTPVKTTAPKQAFYISNEEVFEIDGKVVFFVTNLTDEAIKVNLGTKDGLADSSDYTSKSGVLELAPYQTKPFEVAITQDNKKENAEKFYLKGILDSTSLSNLHSKYGQYNVNPYSVGTCTIYDNNPIDINISQPVVVENDPSGKIKFIITLSKAVNETLTFDVFTDDDTAIAGDDYTAINKTIFIPAGTTRYELEVDIANDNEAEKPEKEVFGLWLSPTNSTQIQKYDLKGYYQSYGTIYDDDGETVYITIQDKTLQEGDERCYLDKIAVTLSRALKDNETISVNFSNQILYFNQSTGTTLYYDFEHDGDLIVNAQKITTHTLSPIITSQNVNNNLKITVQNYINLSNEDRKKEIKNLVYKWVGVENNAKFTNLNLLVA